MKVVLNVDVKKLGYRGDVVKVKDGHFRNFLFPNGLAMPATVTRMRVAEGRKKRMTMMRQEILDNAKDVLKKLKGLKVVLKSKVTKTGKLYGALTELDVIAAIEEAKKVKLERDFIKMDHIKTVGDHKIKVHLGQDLEEEITVCVESL